MERKLPAGLSYALGVRAETVRVVGIDGVAGNHGAPVTTMLRAEQPSSAGID